MPAVDQFRLSPEYEAENVFPERTRRTHFGATTPETSASCWELLPGATVSVRASNIRLLFGVRQSSTYFDVSASVSRIMMPAFAHELVFSTVITRATTT